MSRLQIAFSGSGFLAPAHAGVAYSLLKNGFTFEQLAGTSGGSIIAAMLAIGKTQEDFKTMALHTNFGKLLNFNLWAILDTWSFSSGNALEKWLKKNLGKVTFKDLSMPLYIVSTNLTDGSIFVFSKENTPDVPLYYACRSSASVPFGYSPIKDGKNILVDGGMVDNMPGKFLTGGTPRFNIDLKSGYTGVTSSPLEYGLSLVNLLLHSLKSATVREIVKEGEVVIDVDVSGYGFMNTGLTESQKLDLFIKGYDAVNVQIPSYFKGLE